MIRYGERFGTLDWTTDSIYLLRYVHSKALASDAEYVRMINDGEFIVDH